MRTSLAGLALLLTAGALGACTNASLAEAYGQPDPFKWTYFEGSPQDVITALEQTFNQGEIRIESYQEEGGGTVLTVAPRSGSADVTQILVQATDVEDYTARAQVYPQGAPLPRWLEIEVSGRI